MASSLNAQLLKDASNNRHGVALNAQFSNVSKSDIDSIFHVGVPSTIGQGWKSASGGVAFNKEDALLAAIGESIERYCAGIVSIEERKRNAIDSYMRIDAESFALYSPEQRQKENFPFTNIYSDTCGYSQVFHLGTNKEKWVPHPLIVLRDDYATGIPTSSGLAAGTTVIQALVRAAQELIERDALMTTWIHSIAGQSIKIPHDLQKLVDDLDGEVYAFDLTPSYSPFPVIAVAGGIPQRGGWRYSLGVACRETLDNSLTKAFLEWSQGIYFAGVYPKHVETTSLRDSHDVNNFDEHAVYYTQNPHLWDSLPLFAHKNVICKPRILGQEMDMIDALRVIVTSLQHAGIDMYYRDLTTIDALQSGIRVVRVLSPHLVPIHSHHLWPFLGGNASDVSMRYENPQVHGIFPNPFPHPLG